jgi:hypothetical protein
MAKSCRRKWSEQKAAFEIVRGGFNEIAHSLAMTYLATEVLADRS